MKKIIMFAFLFGCGSPQYQIDYQTNNQQQWIPPNGFSSLSGMSENEMLRGMGVPLTISDMSNTLNNSTVRHYVRQYDFCSGVRSFEEDDRVMQFIWRNSEWIPTTASIDEENARYHTHSHTCSQGNVVEFGDHNNTNTIQNRLRSCCHEEHPQIITITVADGIVTIVH